MKTLKFLLYAVIAVACTVSLLCYYNDSHSIESPIVPSINVTDKEIEQIIDDAIENNNINFSKTTVDFSNKFVDNNSHTSTDDSLYKESSKTDTKSTDADPNCKICGGNIFYTCTSCGGDSLRVCSLCNGKKEACIICNGNGNIKCMGCAGLRRTCSICDGSGVTNCISCNGSGYSFCFSCRNTGTVECFSCIDGKATCSICANINQMSSEQIEQIIAQMEGNLQLDFDTSIYTNTNCSICHGNGRVTCNMCDGKGKFFSTRDSIDLGGGSSSYQISSTCKTCAGSGMMDCIYC